MPGRLGHELGNRGSHRISGALPASHSSKTAYRIILETPLFVRDYLLTKRGSPRPHCFPTPFHRHPEILLK